MIKILPYRLVNDYASKKERAFLRGVIFNLTRTLNLSQAEAAAWLLWLTTTTGNIEEVRIKTQVERGREELKPFLDCFSKCIDLKGAGLSYVLIGSNGTCGIIVLDNGEYHKWQMTDSIESAYYRFTGRDIGEFSELMSKQSHSYSMN